MLSPHRPWAVLHDPWRRWRPWQSPVLEECPAPAATTVAMVLPADSGCSGPGFFRILGFAYDDELRDVESVRNDQRTTPIRANSSFCKPGFVPRIGSGFASPTPARDAAR